ncbi:RNase adapter RapZ [Solirhodobacter olei]|uniref:RNase adapter RapZ n=1 Tax=Solirhodobacter olei TaxID=2493082 RepID=UPI000FD7AC79|nr:RNase adapter RapZ [Solirhodobacter olei]
MTENGGYRLVLVTGPSGAGRSTAIHAFEDLGYEAIDNLPLSLVPRLLDGPPLPRPIALGIDVRNREFSVNAFLALVDRLTRAPDVSAEVLFLDCAPEELIRRYAQTRRRHPMAPAEAPAEGVAREIELLEQVRARADVLVDTTRLTPHELAAEIGRWFGTEGGPRLTVSVFSFSYRRGVPQGVDLVFDTRFLRNPHWQAALREKDGRDPDVSGYVEADERFADYFRLLTDLVLLMLPAQLAEGRAHLAIAFGCTGGQHRSVAVAEKLSEVLAEAGWQVSKRHLELERRAG